MGPELASPGGREAEYLVGVRRFTLRQGTARDEDRYNTDNRYPADNAGRSRRADQGQSHSKSEAKENRG